MPDALRFFTYDVFTTQRFAGNPLAIVLDADELSPEAMQVMAREFNLSETIFVQKPEDAAHAAKVRIFFPTAEIPFAGHPTIGCAIHLATQNAPDGDFDTVLTLEEQAGLVPVRVWRENGDIRAEFQAPVIPVAVSADNATPTGFQDDIQADLLAQAVELSRDDIGFGRHRPGVFEGGPRFLYIPVRDLDALAKARPIEPAWSRVMENCAVDSAYLYTGTGEGYQARMFSPTAGIPEDPATGSASAILAAQLLASGALRDGETVLELRQGMEMGRPSRIGFRALVSDGKLTEVHISGSAVQISHGQVIAAG